jgi:biotin carboxyl carrier protein
MKYRIRIDDKEFAVEILSAADGQARVAVDGATYEIAYSGGPETVKPAVAAAESAVSRPAVTQPAPKTQVRTAAGPGSLLAPIPGIILQVLVKAGDTVKAGQIVAVMEAMKMENNLTAETAGTVREVRVQKGSEVATGDVILIIQA